MAVTGKIKKIDATDTEPEKEIFEVEFSNGTVTQLRDLAEFLSTQGISLPEEDENRLEEVVKLGIAYLLRSKEKTNQK